MCVWAAVCARSDLFFAGEGAHGRRRPNIAVRDLNAATLLLLLLLGLLELHHAPALLDVEAAVDWAGHLQV